MIERDNADITKIVITGANGFIGKSLLSSISPEQRGVHAIVRRFDHDIAPTVSQHVIDDLAVGNSDMLAEVMEGAHYLIHLAAVLPRKDRPIVKGLTRDIADAVALAANKGRVKRVIVMSSVAAELAYQGNVRAQQYGYDKMAADQAFRNRLDHSHVVFLRPPVVYGNGMSGALLALAKLVSSGIWLPLGLAKQKRSYISIVNLIDLLLTLIDANEQVWENATGRQYVPTDGNPVDTISVVNAISASIGVKARIFPVPIFLLRFGGMIIGKPEMISGAIDPLPYNDNDRLLLDFGWKPKVLFPATHACWPRQALTIEP